MEFSEFLLGLKGPLFSALERIRSVIAENRMYRDMTPFKNKGLDRDSFYNACKKVLDVDLLKEELEAVFDFFDKDGDGTGGS